MKIIDYVLTHKSFFWLLMTAVAISGVFSYFHLGRLEYPTFKIKKATVVTLYPGATAREVENEVTDKIEEEIQKMSQIDNITSVSRSGFSLIYVEILGKYSTGEIPQIWDELRRKVNDIKPYLPSGVSGVKVGDDFGDVYGIFLSLSGRGYTIDELKDYADLLKKELLRVPDVAKIALWGVPEKTVYVEFNRAKLSNLRISQEKLFQTLSSSNLVEDAGAVKIGDEYTRFRVTGGINGIEAIRNLYVSDSEGRLFRIGDIAEVKRGHAEPDEQLMRFNGQPAVGIGISTVDGGNVVRMGEAIKERLAQLENSRPAGMEINFVNYQSENVQESLNNFIINLIESVLIVIGILLLTMGWRSGLVIGITLLLIIFGTFIGMDLAKIDMQLVSLGALIIALGMLVDNAIVIVDGYLVKTSRGTEKPQALKEIVTETQWPLLGATVVAILAFLAVGFNEGNIGEFCRSLFDVIAISLILSWIMALTFTPLLCLLLIKVRPVATESGDVYDGRIYSAYRKLLQFCLRRRTAVLLLILLGLGLAGWGYGKLPKVFFPDSTRKQFYVDYWRNQASHIDETEKDVEAIANYIRTLPGVQSTTTFVGEGALRFILSYDYNSPSPDYGQIVVDVDDFRKIDGLSQEINKYLRNNYPSADAMFMRFSDGISIPFKVEARFRGPDAEVLRQLAAQAKEIMRENGNTQYIRDDWRDPVKTIQLNYSEIKARRTGISRKDLAQALQWNFNGVTCGILRENNTLIPIISRPVAAERKNIGELDSVRIWSSAAGKSYSLAQACDGVETVWEAPQIRHRDRVPTVTVQCSPVSGTAAELQKKLQKRIEAIELPPLYSLEWGGELEQSRIAEAKLKTLFPVSLILMFLIVAMLFRTLRETITAFAVLPFALIGVVGGLFLLNLPFGFMAILGFLGLSGMLLKNAIVLLDQINLELQKGMPHYSALLNASVSRLRPVTMAAGTTVLGVAPLLFDTFFASMAATIMFGLLGATILTLFVLPVTYSLLFRVRS